LAEKVQKKDVVIQVDTSNAIFATVVQQGGALDIRLHQGMKRKADFPVLEGDFVIVPAESGGGFVLVPVGNVVTPKTIQQALDKMNVRYLVSDPVGVMRMIVRSRRQFKFRRLAVKKRDEPEDARYSGK
jgi:hypothetical protein